MRAFVQHFFRYMSCLVVGLMVACAGGGGTAEAEVDTLMVDTPESPCPSPIVRCVDGSWVVLTDFDTTLRADIRYAGNDNFMGRPMAGYLQPLAVATRPTAEALSKVNADLREQGLALLIFDAYRPQRAVDDIYEWSKVSADTLMRWRYYPRIAKRDIRFNGYISKKSKHAMGSTVDLTLVRIADGEEVDMGSSFDMLDPISHFNAPGLTAEQRANRQLLRRTMCRHGFSPIEAEWWHFTLRNQPYHNAFDFPVHRDSVILFLRL